MSTGANHVWRFSGPLSLALLLSCAGNVEGPAPLSHVEGSEQSAAQPPASDAPESPPSSDSPPAAAPPSADEESNDEPNAPSSPPRAETPPATPDEDEETPTDPVVVPEDGTLRILPLGDSITLGVSGGYRNDLYQLLSDDGQAVDYVGTQWDTSTEIADKDHEGHPGFTIANARAGVDGWLDAMTRPDVVLVMLGTNDEAWWTTKYPSETRDEMLELVDHLLDRLPDAVLVVATIPPQTSANVEPIDLDRSDMVEEFNALTKVAIADHSAFETRLFLADVNAVLTLEDLYDGIHPSRDAHREIAAVFHSVLKPLL